MCLPNGAAETEHITPPGNELLATRNRPRRDVDAQRPIDAAHTIREGALLPQTTRNDVYAGRGGAKTIMRWCTATSPVSRSPPVHTTAPATCPAAGVLLASDLECNYSTHGKQRRARRLTAPSSHSTKREQLTVKSTGPSQFVPRAPRVMRRDYGIVAQRELSTLPLSQRRFTLAWDKRVRATDLKRSP